MLLESELNMEQIFAFKSLHSQILKFWKLLTSVPYVNAIDEESSYIVPRQFIASSDNIFRNILLKYGQMFTEFVLFQQRSF